MEYVLPNGIDIENKSTILNLLKPLIVHDDNNVKKSFKIEIKACESELACFFVINFIISLISDFLKLNAILNSQDLTR